MKPYHIRIFLTALVLAAATSIMAQPTEEDQRLCRKHSIETARIIVDAIADGVSQDEVAERLFPLGAQTLSERTAQQMLWAAETNAKLSLKELTANGYSFCLSNSY